jgi:putative N6-adenine-specific DNA methylase
MEYEYQKYGRFFAVVAGKMEDLLAEELEELGVDKVQIAYRGVSFFGSLETLYKINYQSRLATRILAPLMTFKCKSPKILIPESTFPNLFLIFRKNFTNLYANN